MREAAQEAIRLCHELATYSEEPGKTTRTFLVSADAEKSIECSASDCGRPACK